MTTTLIVSEIQPGGREQTISQTSLDGYRGLGGFGMTGGEIATLVIGIATVIINGVVTIFKVIKEGEFLDKQLAQKQADYEAQQQANAWLAQQSARDQANAIITSGSAASDDNTLIYVLLAAAAFVLLSKNKE